MQTIIASFFACLAYSPYPAYRHYANASQTSVGPHSMSPSRTDYPCYKAIEAQSFKTIQRTVAIAKSSITKGPPIIPAT